MKGYFHITVLLIFTLLIAPQKAFAGWSYWDEKDKITDAPYSIAKSESINYKYNNKFNISFMCRDRNIRFEINTGTYISSKNSEFTFIYRVDDKKAKTITLKTFDNSEVGGYTYSDVDIIEDDIRGGKNIFVRAVSWDNDYLETTLSLKDSEYAIYHVFADCKQEKLSEKREASANLSDNFVSKKKVYVCKSLNEYKEDMKVVELFSSGDKALINVHNQTSGSRSPKEVQLIPSAIKTIYIINDWMFIDNNEGKYQLRNTSSVGNAEKAYNCIEE